MATGFTSAIMYMYISTVDKFRLETVSAKESKVEKQQFIIEIS